jgi:hypothetical protein
MLDFPSSLATFSFLLFLSSSLQNTSTHKIQNLASYFHLYKNYSFEFKHSPQNWLDKVNNRRGGEKIAPQLIKKPIPWAMK